MFLSRFVPQGWLVPARYYYHLMTHALEAEVGYLPTLINRRGVTIDVGAFNGDYSYALAKLSK